MKGKKGHYTKYISFIVFVVLLIALVSIQTNAQTTNTQKMTDCNNAGGVWCTDQSGTDGTCVKGTDSEPANYGDTICYIKQDENVTITDPQKKYFTFNKLTIETSMKLWFVSTQSVACTPAAKGGDGGNSGVHQGCGGEVVNSNGQNNGIKVNGGAGGDTCKVGGNGGGGYLWSSALRGGLAGASVTILANSFEINGILSVAGIDGANAPTVTGDEGTCGRAGGAGAGGGGGGVLKLTSPLLISGSGSIDVSGGNGGDGSSGTNENYQDEGFCGHCTDHGASGGGGGGGATGFIISTNNNVQLEHNPGKDGRAGDAVASCIPTVCGAANPGKDGSESEQPQPLIETHCNNGKDDDGDHLVDMDDPDCYSMVFGQAHEYNWNTTIHSDYNTTSWYNASALNGNDLSCGDDLSGNCVSTDLQGKTCSGFSNDQDACQSAGCTYNIIPLNQYTLNGGPEDTFYCTADDAPQCNSGDKEISTVPGSVRCEDNNGYPNGNSYDYVASRVCENETASCTGTIQAQDCNTKTTKKTCDANAGCTWQSTGIGDEGSITGDGKYACFKSNAGQNNNWIDAEDQGQVGQYEIKRAGTTDFITNGQEWYYCNADGKSTYGDIPNKMPEYGTFDSTLSNGKYACADALLAVFLGSSIENCYNTTQNCLQKYKQGDGNPETNIFCVGNIGQDGSKTPASFSATDFSNQGTGFNAQCINTNCFIKDDDNNWKLISNSNKYQNVYNPTSFNDLCAASGDSIAGCSATNNGYDGSQDVNSNDPSLCAADPSLCLGEYIDSTSSCKRITEALGQDYFSKRKCEQGQYCNKGTLVYSTETGQTSPQYQCCIGAEAYCENYQSGTCISIGGKPKPEGDDVTCIGNEVSGDCCIGTWSTPPSQLLQDTTINESFICYKRQNQNLIQECCPIGGCYNYDKVDNELNNGGTTNIYSYKGYPLNMLVSFDQQGASARIQQNTYTGLSSKNPIQITKSNFQIEDFTGFQYIEFDYATNNPATGIFVLDDGTKNQTYNLSEQKYKATRKSFNKFNRYKIPLSEATINGVDISKIQNLWITFSKLSLSAAILDNIYLSAGPSNSEDSQTNYCTGAWRTWVSNLDGPVTGPDANRGFYADSKVPTQAKQYEEACNAQDSFGWTGSACCGDDSASGYGEFFADTNGICWNGTKVRSGQTPNFATGIPSSLGGSILYYNGKESLCNTDKSAYNKILQSFGDVSENTKLLDSSKADVEEVTPFSIRGSWMCSQTSQWIKLSDINKVELLSSILYNSSISEPAFTLFCGNITKVSNYIPSSFFNPEGDNPALISMLNSACLLHQGNAQTLGGKVYFGFDISNQITFEDFNTSLGAFNPFSESGLDCSNIPDNPDTNEFFKSCDITNENVKQHKFVVYYNKPFNMMIIGNNVLRGGTIENPGLINYIIKAWDDFTGFFTGLFSTKPNSFLPDFSTNGNIKDIYITKQGDKVIRGIMEFYAGENHAKVDYFKLSQSVEFLKDALALNLSLNAYTTYVSGGNNQTIYVRSPATEDINWKILTSILRITSDKAPKDFGTAICGNGKAEYGEECDGTNLNGYPSNCSEYDSALYSSGTITCNSTCQLNTSSCV